jgi:hypothetical protein
MGRRPELQVARLDLVQQRPLAEPLTAPFSVQLFLQKSLSIPPKIQKTKDRKFSCLLDLWFLR